MGPEALYSCNLLFFKHTIHQLHLEVICISLQLFTHNRSLPGGLHCQLVHMVVPGHGDSENRASPHTQKMMEKKLRQTFDNGIQCPHRSAAL